ncbi:MAG: translation initiation factor 2 [Gammaproteobacteria bacterium]|nr:translation initiation factor 2 [Gammaproteobacteria bacterium]
MVAEDVRRLVISTVGRLGRETQLHLDERYRHFWVTNLLIIIISILLIVVAIFNVYYIRVLYQDLNVIVFNMDSMHTHLRVVKGSMDEITHRVESFDRHMANMDEINRHTSSMSDSLPRIANAMRDMSGEVHAIRNEMAVLQGSMISIDQRVVHMIGGVASMRENVHQIARPMGVMNPFLP